MLQNILQTIPILFITGIVQIAKEFFNMPSKYARIASFIIALVFGVLFVWNADITKTITDILMYALSAIGLWEVSKNGIRKVKSKIKKVA